MLFAAEPRLPDFGFFMRVMLQEVSLQPMPEFGAEDASADFLSFRGFAERPPKATHRLAIVANFI